MNLAKQRMERVRIEIVALVHAVDECLHVFALRVGFRAQVGAGKGQDDQEPSTRHGLNAAIRLLSRSRSPSCGAGP